VRLLVVCQVDHPGGAEVGVLRLARRLRDRGWEVVLTSPGEGPLAHQGFEHTCLDVGGLAGGAGARAVASWPKVRRLGRAFEAVYLNGTVAGRLLPALRGQRTVLHVHDMVDRVPRHWRSADVVLADSQAVANRLHDLDPVVVHCPVELDVAAGPCPWTPDDRPVVGFVGRFEPRKGPLDLVAAAPLVRERRPDARIVLVGGDPYGDDPDYAAAVRAATDVEVVGWVDDAAQVMPHLDVLVAPSRNEPFGTVLSEAMAAGVPVVATDVDGLPEVVTDGVDGRLVGVGDVPALAAAILDVLEHRETMGAAARDAAKRFDADAYADRVAALIAGEDGDGAPRRPRAGRAA
jgi:glycosyltransferase involved in cell wall biosynthesis